MSVSCGLCGREADPATEGDPPLGWSSETVGPSDGLRWICPRCTRENVRAIEAKLDQDWW